jgi:hypothetical protein
MGAGEITRKINFGDEVWTDSQLVRFVMPDQIRHPEQIALAGFRLVPE